MKVLVIIDLQNDFITGSLGTPKAQAIVHKVCEKIVNWDGEIIFTQDTHFVNYLDTQEGKKLPVVHCIKHTDGWKICNEVIGALKYKTNKRSGVLSHGHNETPQKYGYRVFEKDTFGSYDLVSSVSRIKRFEEENISEIQLVGLCTDICVISNALILKSFLPEVPIIVDASCCAGVTPESHKNALEAMKMCQIEIINEYLDELEK